MYLLMSAPAERFLIDGVIIAYIFTKEYIICYNLQKKKGLMQ